MSRPAKTTDLHTKERTTDAVSCEFSLDNAAIFTFQQQEKCLLKVQFEYQSLPFLQVSQPALVWLPSEMVVQMALIPAVYVTQNASTVSSIWTRRTYCNQYQWEKKVVGKLQGKHHSHLWE